MPNKYLLYLCRGTFAATLPGRKEPLAVGFTLYTFTPYWAVDEAAQHYEEGDGLAHLDVNLPQATAPTHEKLPRFRAVWEQPGWVGHWHVIVDLPNLVHTTASDVLKLAVQDTVAEILAGSFGESVLDVQLSFISVTTKPSVR